LVAFVVGVFETAPVRRVGVVYRLGHGIAGIASNWQALYKRVFGVAPSG
jgi:hypothetical protein